MFSFENKKKNSLLHTQKTTQKKGTAEHKAKNPFLSDNESTENPFLANPNNNSNPVQMLRNPFAKKKKGSIEQQTLKARPTKGEDADSANDVYKMKDKKGGLMGFGKRQEKIGDVASPTSEFLNIPAVAHDDGPNILKKNPALLTRAVLSSQLDQALGLDVLAKESIVNAKVKGSNKTQTMGLSGLVAGKALKRGGKRDVGNGKGIQDVDLQRNVDYKNPETQKGMSNLQLLDAITGQQDRHGGNIFVDDTTGKVKGIDNDMAFGKSRKKIFDGQWGENALKGQFSKDKDGALKYHQKQIDEMSGESVLAMTEEQLLNILEQQHVEGEALTDNEKETTLERFRAVKARTKHLKDKGKLVKNWGDDTFEKSMSDKGKYEKQMNEGGGEMEEHHNYTGKHQTLYDTGFQDNEPQTTKKKGFFKSLFKSYPK